MPVDAPDAPLTPEIPLNIKPPRVSEEDRMLLALTNERERRISAELENLKLADTHLKGEALAFQTERKTVMDGLKEKYKLGTADSVDVKTGLITRNSP